MRTVVPILRVKLLKVFKIIEFLDFHIVILVNHKHLFIYMKVQPTIIIQNCILSFKYNLLIIGFNAGLHFVLDTLKVHFYCLLNCSLSCRAPKPYAVKFLNKALTINFFLIKSYT